MCTGGDYSAPDLQPCFTVNTDIRCPYLSVVAPPGFSDLLLYDLYMRVR